MSEQHPDELDGGSEPTDEEKEVEAEFGPEEANDDGPEEDEKGEEVELEDDDDGPEEDPTVPLGVGEESEVDDEPAD